MGDRSELLDVWRADRTLYTPLIKVMPPVHLFGSVIANYGAVFVLTRSAFTIGIGFGFAPTECEFPIYQRVESSIQSA